MFVQIHKYFIKSRMKSNMTLKEFIIYERELFGHSAYLYVSIKWDTTVFDWGRVRTSRKRWGVFKKKEGGYF